VEVRGAPRDAQAAHQAGGARRDLHRRHEARSEQAGPVRDHEGEGDGGDDAEVEDQELDVHGPLASRALHGPRLPMVAHEYRMPLRFEVPVPVEGCRSFPALNLSSQRMRRA
jgi:hypothetical protein